ncbi:PREDICTED: phosphatidylinositol transfer protein alpha isoform-like [Amphimedon queenslandica]|uniref:Phosphatidylinositol transfer protein N-terminal domain-containing protein n=1 Tax=Amphimedon queenslandica TaxID=400682 RepID=A0A1X7UQV9_AMPQE|nr:PREDICTED: phosphatidylinositol transfer protein alpha isoform-like [Amphimedon queenslandica]|eukprot:XP_003387142.1 PREDICTED: phosphatidylinositol transfer protein alpha isoform-like [Amphimedon queenslandica]
MLIKEFRIILPFTPEEYHVGQLWSVAQASKNETGGGDGVEVVINEERDFDKHGKGQFTHKIFHLSHKVPRFVRALAPKGSLEVHEEAINAFPYIKTDITNPDYMKDGFKITIESIHIADDRGLQENVHNLPPDLLKLREVVTIDIVNDPYDPRDYKPEWDPRLVRSERADRGPLKPDWKESSQPIMCAYKLVTCEFKWWGLQTRVESMIMKAERRIFTSFHRQVYCWLDEWYGMTMDDIRRIEEETRKALEEARTKGELRGMSEQ